MLRRTESPRLPEHFTMSAVDLNVTAGPNKLLRGVNLDFVPGEFVVLRGVNGSGKSTLLHFLAGLGLDGTSSPTGGEVCYGRQSVYKDYDEKQRRLLLGTTIAFTPQNFAEGLRDRPQMTFEEHVLFPFQFSSSRVSRDRLREATKYYGVQRLLDRPIGPMSGGEQQLVPLIQTEIVSSRHVHMLDEPLSALHSERADMATARLRSLAEERGETVIMISHRSEPLAMRTVEFADGQVLSDIPEQNA